MFEEILKNFNWLDVAFLAILLRCAYIGATRGLMVEVLKFLGIMLSIFITQHYFVTFAVFLTEFVAVPESIAEITAFIFLWIIIVVFFKFLRDGLFLFMKKKKDPWLKRLSGGLLGVSRGVLISSLIFPLIYLSGSNYLEKTSRNSYAGFYIEDISPKIYEGAFGYIVKPLFANEERNEKALRLRHLEKLKPEKTEPEQPEEI